MDQDFTDTTAQVAMYGGAATAGTIWHLQLGDVGVIVSMLVAVLGFAVHAWALWRKDRRAQELHQLNVEALRGAKAAVKETGAGDAARN